MKTFNARNIALKSKLKSKNNKSFLAPYHMMKIEDAANIGEFSVEFNPEIMTSHNITTLKKLGFEVWTIDKGNTFFKRNLKYVVSWEHK